MLPISRLLLPLYPSADQDRLPPAGHLHPARLDLEGPLPRLIIESALGPTGRWQCQVDRPIWQPVMAAFAPHVDGFGRLQVRPCLAMVGQSSTHLIIDLIPQSGPRRTVSPGVDPAAGRRRLPIPPAAAVLAACVALPAAATTYEVRPGDTLSSISRTLLGSTSGWRQLYRLNRQLVPDPHRLVPGTILQVPAPERATPPEAAGQPETARQRVVVRPGDTLFSLAKRHLGDGKRWPELWASLRHRLSSPSRLPVGLAIPLPDTIAAQPRLETAAPPPPDPIPPVADPTPSGPSATAETPAPAATPPVAATSPPAARDAVASSDAPARPDSGEPAREPAVPAVLVPALTVATIERPFASHVGVSFDPVTYHEAIVPQQVTARGTIFNAFGAEASWRLTDWLLLSGNYLFNGYPLTRIQPTGDRRSEHHGRLTAYLVWPLLPHVEVAGGLGGQWTGYGVSAGPPVERPEDLYDSGYQRWLSHAEARVGWRPWPDHPLTLTAGLQAVPVGQGFRLGSTDPVRLWGIGWTAGARYSLGGLALEATYRGQRLFGDGYGQSADLLHTGIAYYFR